MSTTDSRTRQLARSTLVVMIAFAAAKAISLIQTVIIAQVFGVSAEYDAFVIANRLPEQIYNLIAGGAIAFAFIPVFTGLLAHSEVKDAWRTASHVINTIFSLTFIVSALAFLFAPWLVANIIAPGFNPASQEQTVGLMRILLFSTVIFSVSGLAGGILHSHNQFLLPALAPIMFDLGILFGVAFLIPLFDVYGIAYGAVIGALLHFGIQIPGLVRVKMQWSRGWGWRDPNLRRIIKLMLPRVVDVAFSISISAIVTANILSRLGTGSASAFDWGWRIMQIPETLIGTAMGVVIFPTLAALSSLGDLNGKRDAMSGAVRFILMATIPSAVGLILLGRPTISLLEGGAFDSSASALVYSTLQFFAFGLVVHSVLEVISRSFYADKDTLTPLWTAIIGAAINIALSLLLSNVSRVNSMGFHNAVALQFPYFGLRPDVGSVGGLALANTLGVLFEVLALGFVLRRRWHGLNENALAQTAVKTLAASLVMALAVIMVESLWTAMGLAGQGRLLTLVQLGIETAVGVIVFVGAALLLRMDELKTLIELVLRRRRLSEAPA